MNLPAKQGPVLPTRILIKGGQVVNSDRTENLDVIIENGIISGMGYDLSVPDNASVLRADGLLVIPGGIDPHTHLDFEFMGARSVDDFYKGTRAAVAGGTTMIIDHAIAKPGQSLLEIYDKYRRMADPNVCCDYGLHIGVTWWSNTVRKEMELLCGYHGVNSFKFFMAYKNLYMIDDSELYEAFIRCGQLGAIAMVHAENGHVIEKNVERLKAAGIFGPEGHGMSRSEDVEAEAVNRAAMIAKEAGCPLYVVHVMSESAANVIEMRRKKGQTNLYGEALAAGIGTVAPGVGCAFEVAAAHVMSPPLRTSNSTPVALMKSLASGHLQTTATDNCTFNKEQKALGKTDFTKIPNGVNGIEDRMSIVWSKGVATGMITPQKFVEITSTNAAKIFNMYPRKGCIEVGSDADIVLWNPNKTRNISAETHHQACDYNIFEGMVVTGVAETVIVKGTISYQNGQLTNSVGHGKYVSRRVFPHYVYAKIGEAPANTESVNSDNSYKTQYCLQTLNFQERQILTLALKKSAPMVFTGSLKLFKEFDSAGFGKISTTSFFQVLQAIDVLQFLSSRETEILTKAFSSTTDNPDEIYYEQFVGACNEQCGSKEQCEPFEN